jgi:hypothetical protein
MPVWKVRSWHSCQVLLRERLAGGKSEARLDPIAIGGLGTHLRVEFESCLDIRLKSSDVDYEHHDPRKNVKMVRTIKRNGAEGTGEWDTDMRRVVSFATRERAAALSSLPTPVRTHHHQHREIARSGDAH